MSDEVTKLVLDYESFHETVREPRDDEWDKGEVEVCFRPIKLRLGEQGDSWIVETFEMHSPVKVGDELFLVVVRYDTGDTFGKTYGEYIFVGLYEDYEEVDRVEKSIKDNSHERSGAWTGYFDTYRYTEVHAMKVRPALK